MASRWITAGVAKSRLTRVACAANLLGFGMIAGCNWLGGGERDYAFRGRYEAVKGGYRVYVSSRGAVPSGNELASTSRAAVRICPAASSTAGSARPIEFTLTMKRGDPKVWLESGRDTPVLEWNWKTGKAVLQSMLIANGITPAPEELMGSVDVVSSALSGPKGLVLKDQIRTLRVLGTEVESGQEFDLTQPIENWARIQDLPPCSAS